MDSIIEKDKVQGDELIFKLDAGAKKCKTHACLFCGTEIVNLSRHFNAYHPEEPQVKNVLRIENLAERRKALDVIRKLGNFQHNAEIIKKSKEGEIITKYKTNAPEECLPCPTCKGYYKKFQLSRHSKGCRPGSPETNDNPVCREAVVLKAAYLEASEGLTKEVLNKMKNGELKDAVLRDKLVIFYGNHLYQKHKARKHLSLFISCKLKELARLVVAVESVDQTYNLETILIPTNFPLFINCTKKIAGYDDKTGKYTNPYLATKTGNAIILIAKLLKAQYIIDGKDTKPLEDFLALMQTRWSIEISQEARNTIAMRSYNKDEELPTTEDIVMLRDYLVEKIKHLVDRLQSGFHKTTVEELREVVLVRLIVFNRKRPGETQRLTVEQFRKRQHVNETSDVFKRLLQEDKKAATKYCHIDMVGKQNRKVSLMCCRQTETAMELIQKFRARCGVKPENTYFFWSKGLSCLRGHILLKKYANLCGAKGEGNLRATKLRKHLATSVGQCLEDNPRDIKVVANYMGHSQQIHESVYRVGVKDTNLARVSKLLEATDSGGLTRAKRKATLKHFTSKKQKK